MVNTFVNVGGKNKIDKSPGSDLNYSWNWNKWLNGDQIGTFRVTCKGVVLEEYSLTGDVVTAVVSGGTHGVEAWIQCEITTLASPQKVETRRLYLVITQR